MAQPDRTLLPAQRLNILDRAITFFSPEYGVKAMMARNQLFAFGYNDNVERRGRAPSLSTSAGSENWAKNRDRLKAMADARDACQYDWIGGVMGKVVLYVCGNINAKSTTGDEQIDQAYDDYFHNWCGDERSDDGLTRCDITGRHRFSKMVQMAFLAMLVDGDHGLLEVDPTMSPTAQQDEAGQYIEGTGEFCLQNVEADRIGSPIESSVLENYIGGITLDEKNGRIQSYRVYRRTRTNQYVDQQEVPVDAFIHVFDPDRSDEYRGRTHLLRILNDLRDIREWIEAEKIAGKTQSQWAAMIGTKDPFSNQGAAAWSGKTDAGTPTQDAQWGKILKMAEGEQFSMLSPSNRPSGAFMAFVQMIIRKMAAALNLPFGFLWDLSQLGGVTARIEVQGALRQIQYWQDNILVNLILNRVRQKVIAQGIAKGELPGCPAWKKCEWHFGPWITTDAGYEMQNDIQGVSAGILPISQVAAKYGMSPREVFVSNCTTANEAVGVGAEMQMPVEVFAKGLYPDITAQKAAFAQSLNPPPPPPPASLQAVGDKGVSQLIEILQSVKDQTMDRESAINTLITVFDMQRQQAELMCPEEPTPAEIEAQNPAPAAPGKQSSSQPKKPK